MPSYPLPVTIFFQELFLTSLSLQNFLNVLVISVFLIPILLSGHSTWASFFKNHYYTKNCSQEGAHHDASSHRHFSVILLNLRSFGKVDHPLLPKTFSSLSILNTQASFFSSYFNDYFLNFFADSSSSPIGKQPNDELHSLLYISSFSIKYNVYTNASQIPFYNSDLSLKCNNLMLNCEFNIHT